MNLGDLDQLFERVRRITSKLEDKAGPGTSWDYTFPDGATTTYEITNVKTHEELQDHCANLAVWTWSIKDYLSGLSATLGTTPTAIEDYVNKDPALPLCADLANMLKHGELKTSRSGKWPFSARVSYVMRQDPRAQANPIRSITFTPTAVKTDVGNPELVEIKFSVRDRSGSSLGDGLEWLAAGVSAWESLFQHLN